VRGLNTMIEVPPALAPSARLWPPTSPALAGPRKSALLLAFCLPLLVCFEFTFIGRVHLAEIALIGLLPVWILQRQAPMDRRVWLLLVLGALWLASQIITDQIRGTPPADYLRGWAKISLFLLLFYAMQLFIGRSPQLILAFGMGLAAGGACKYFFFRVDYAVGDTAVNYWKFGLGGPVTGLLICLLCLGYFRRRPMLSLSLLSALTFAHMMLGARSASLIVFATTACLAIHALRVHGFMRSRSSLLLWSGTVFAASGVILWFIYSISLDSRYAGIDLRAKHELQSQAKGGILVGGRSEFLIAMRAIYDSPLLGHGSWAKNAKYANMDLAEYGLDRRDGSGVNLIPTHSHIFGAWVEAGILGGLFWLVVLALTLRGLLSVFRWSHSLTPLVVFTAIGLLWSIPFSPFGFEDRFFMAFEISIILYQLRLGGGHPEGLLSKGSRRSVRKVLRRSPMAGHLHGEPAIRSKFGDRHYLSHTERAELRAPR